MIVAKFSVDRPPEALVKALRNNVRVRGGEGKSF